MTTINDYLDCPTCGGRIARCWACLTVPPVERQRQLAELDNVAWSDTTQPERNTP